MFIFKYGDDILCPVPNTMSNLLLNLFIAFNPNLMLTIEIKNNSCTPFLSTKVVRINNKSIFE